MIEKIIVSAEVKTILSDLYNQIEYELREDYDDALQKLQERIDKALQELDKYRINFDFPGFTDKTIENTRKILRGGKK